MTAIDLKTLFLFLIIGNLFTIIFFFIYTFFYNTQGQDLKKYIVARFLQSITWVTYFLNYRDLDSITMAITMVPLAFGIAIEVYCLLLTTERSVIPKLKTLLIIALSHSILYFLVADDNISRVVVASIFLSIYYGFTWVDFSVRKNRTKMQKAAGWIGFFIFILFLNRALQTYLADIDLIVYSTSYFNVLTGIGLTIVSFAWPLIYLLLHKEQDQKLILEQDQKLILKNNQLEKSSKAQDKLFSILSHDLRSPLSSMISFVDLVIYELNENNYSNIETYAKMISQSAQEGYELLDNLLNWNVLKSGKETVLPQKINIERQISHIINLYQISLENKRISIQKDIQPDLNIIADRIMTETVFRNLISNAIKFSNENSTITIKSYKVDDNIAVEITDNGVGITKEKLEKLFDPSSKFSSKGTKNEKGTGLGLLLCKEFVEKNKGQIKVSSELGKGSTFKVVLPKKS